MKRHVAATLLAGALSILGTNLAGAQSVDQYLGEVRLLAFNFCPVQWAQANGVNLPIQTNTALFSLLGTSFGGNGTTNFNLPNLSGRAPYGQASNGEGQPFGAPYGQSTLTLTIGNLPAHTHQLLASTTAPGTNSPANGLLATEPSTTTKVYAPPGSPANVPMAATAVGMTGGNQPISIQSPALSMNWCIATSGIYPSRGQ